MLRFFLYSMARPRTGSYGIGVDKSLRLWYADTRLEQYRQVQRVHCETIRMSNIVQLNTPKPLMMFLVYQQRHPMKFRKFLDYVASRLDFTTKPRQMRFVRKRIIQCISEVRGTWDRVVFYLFSKKVYLDCVPCFHVSPSGTLSLRFLRDLLEASTARKKFATFFRSMFKVLQYLIHGRVYIV